MTVIAKGLRFQAHLACIQIVLDGVGVAHLIVFVLGIIVYLLEEAVSTHVFEVVHLHGATLGGLSFPTAARERQPVKHVKTFSAKVQHGNHEKKGGSICLKHSSHK